MASRILALLALLILSGCAAFTPPRPLTTEAEALAVHGEPTRRWDNGDGTTTLEYSTQPYGHRALMVTVDASGVVIDQYDALSDENLARVKPGMTQDEVSRLLGTHRSVQVFKLSGEEVWDWNVYNDGPGVATLFNVHFIDGKVVRTSRTYVYPRDGMVSGYWYPYSYRYPYGYPFSYRSPYWGWGFGWHGYPWHPW
ncbi:outer membrane protein assembly factor BamE [Azoarcus sp. PA01]|nr:outer membrane protein assembly factor BamE [Azoarcus sp. PA01]